MAVATRAVGDADPGAGPVRQAQQVATAGGVPAIGKETASPRRRERYRVRRKTQGERPDRGGEWAGGGITPKKGLSSESNRTYRPVRSRRPPKMKAESLPSAEQVWKKRGGSGVGPCRSHSPHRHEQQKLVRTHHDLTAWCPLCGRCEVTYRW